MNKLKTCFLSHGCPFECVEERAEMHVFVGKTEYGIRNVEIVLNLRGSCLDCVELYLLFGCLDCDFVMRAVVQCSCSGLLQC